MKKNVVRPEFLPSTLAIPGIQDIFYSFGLSHYSTNKNIKQSSIDKPVMITIVCLIQLIMKLIVIATNDDERTKLQIGDIGCYFGFRLNWSLGVILVASIVLSTQSIYYYNYKTEAKN